MIERIWLTKGDNLTDHEGRKADRMLIFKINGQVYFSDFHGTKDEAMSYLKRFYQFIRVAKTSKGAILWGVASSGGEFNQLDRKVTLCNTHHDDLLDKPLFTNAERNVEGKLWHSEAELKGVMK